MVISPTLRSVQLTGFVAFCWLIYYWFGASLSHRHPDPEPRSVSPRCSTCRGPIHSWATFPVSIHSDRPNTHGPTGLELQEEDLELLAKVPLVTLEKWHGTKAFSTTVCNNTGNCNKSGNVFYWREDAWLATARQIKAVSPNTSVAVWMDTVLIYSDWTWPEPTFHRREPRTAKNFTLNPDGKYWCTTGHFEAAEFLESPSGREYLLRNKSGLPALEPWSGCHVYDFTKENVRRYWTDLCLNMTASGVIDGCGADFSATGKNQWASHTSARIQNWLQLDNATAHAWNKGHVQMMVETTEALGDGLLIGKDSFELGHHVNAVLQEDCGGSNKTILMLQNLTATAKRLGRRLIYQCHSKRAYNASMAAFLCGAGPDHYFTIGPWSGLNGHWVAGFERPLGEPLMDCQYDHRTQTWIRVFASGTVVRFNASSREGAIEWNDYGMREAQQKQIAR